jgi:cyclopropane fatty-acyl-phospholipid synthase-like methyltransferase
MKVSMEFVDTLEEAQLRKIDALLARLEPLGPEHELLDIGFGWGGICIRAGNYDFNLYAFVSLQLSEQNASMLNTKLIASIIMMISF